MARKCTYTRNKMHFLQYWCDVASLSSIVAIEFAELVDYFLYCKSFFNSEQSVTMQ
jgi:hypothetical protein